MKVRPYVQRRRADSAVATGTRILAATVELFREGGTELTLDAVADRAGITVQTVLRRFGSKEGLLQASVEDAMARVAAGRGAAPVGDVGGAVANLVDHYAEWGDVALRLLALEGGGNAISSATRNGRALHHAWVERVFAPLLVGLPEGPRRLAELMAVTDVYVWKILHRDLALSQDEVEAILVDLIQRILT